jgi:hypothetical protein
MARIGTAGGTGRRTVRDDLAADPDRRRAVGD